MVILFDLLLGLIKDKYNIDARTELFIQLMYDIIWALIIAGVIANLIICNKY